MNIDKKIEMFKSGSLIPDLHLSDIKELDKINVRGERKLSGALFEEGVRISGNFDSRSNSFIGAYSYVNSNSLVRPWTAIGRYCSIGSRVTIGASMHRVDGVSSYPDFNVGEHRPYTETEKENLGVSSKRRSRFTIIGSDVWIGDGAVILPGAAIGNGAVVAANSVVTKDVEPYSIVAGVPAKRIRYRFLEHIIFRLQEMRWWELSHSQLMDMRTRNIFDFLDDFSRLSLDQVSDSARLTYILGK